MAHTIEVAKSGRAGCRTCRNPIAKGELRFGEETPNQFGDAGDMSYRWHHLKCAAQKLPDELRTALADYTGEVADRAELDTLMAAADASKPPPFPYADRAPTGRARCLGCGEAIPKGALRVAIERDLERGMGVTKGAGYLHPACAAAYVEAQGGTHEKLTTELRENTRLPDPDLAALFAEV
jgi:Poly(ADP-ribose) polymerase and DNA-Ligase Zn-finger region